MNARARRTAASRADRDLRVALLLGDTAAAKRAIAAKADPDHLDRDGSRPIHRVLGLGDGTTGCPRGGDEWRPDLAEMLIRAGAAIDGQDADEESALELTASCQRRQETDWLLSRGADPLALENEPNGAVSGLIAMRVDGSVQHHVDAAAWLLDDDHRACPPPFPPFLATWTAERLAGNPRFMANPNLIAVILPHAERTPDLVARATAALADTDLHADGSLRIAAWLAAADGGGP